MGALVAYLHRKGGKPFQTCALATESQGAGELADPQVSAALSARQMSDSLVEELTLGAFDRRTSGFEESPDYDPTNLGKVRDFLGGTPDQVEVGRWAVA